MLARLLISISVFQRLSEIDTNLYCIILFFCSAIHKIKQQILFNRSEILIQNVGDAADKLGRREEASVSSSPAGFGDAITLGKRPP